MEERLTNVLAKLNDFLDSLGRCCSAQQRDWMLRCSCDTLSTLSLEKIQDQALPGTSVPRGTCESQEKSGGFRDMAPMGFAWV